MQQERRNRRSNQLGEALGLYLEAARARARADAVVLADDTGLVISGTGRSDVNELLAVVGSRPGLRLELVRGTVHSTPLEVGGSTVHLASLGGAPIPPTEAASAIGRILRV